MAVFHLWKRKIEFCSVCKTQLKHKYKPSKDWKIQGSLCGDCHTLKTKEFVIKQQEEKERQEKEANRCSICGLDIEIDSKKFKPRWQWNMNNESILCNKCYDNKESEFQKERNYCAICNRALKFFRYHPKPKWNIKGQLCKECWDRRNEMSEYKL
jgi:hypothetical protein